MAKNAQISEVTKPLYKILSYIKLFKTLAPGEKTAFIAQVPMEH